MNSTIVSLYTDIDTGIGITRGQNCSVLGGLLAIILTLLNKHFSQQKTNG